MTILPNLHKHIAAILQKNEELGRSVLHNYMKSFHVSQFTRSYKIIISQRSESGNPVENAAVTWLVSELVEDN